MTKFKDALDAFNRYQNKMSLVSVEEIQQEPIADTIRLALRIAQAVTEEPSSHMFEAAYKLRNEDNGHDPDYDRVFRAMIEQMMREVQEPLTP